MLLIIILIVPSHINMKEANQVAETIHRKKMDFHGTHSNRVSTQNTPCVNTLQIETMYT